MLNEIALRIDPLILVLDDYHLLTEAVILEVMEFLLHHQPPQLHLVLTTREDPALPLARLRARDQLTEIRAWHLRFTQEETDAFLRGVMGLELSKRQLLTHSACMPDNNRLTLGLIAKRGESFAPLEEIFTTYVMDNPDLLCEPGKESQYANAHFLQMHLSDGRYGNIQILQPETVAAMHTERQFEVANLAAQGMTLKEVAEKLFISEDTVKTHMYKVYKKLSVKNRRKKGREELKAKLQLIK